MTTPSEFNFQKYLPFREEAMVALRDTAQAQVGSLLPRIPHIVSLVHMQVMRTVDPAAFKSYPDTSLDNPAAMQVADVYVQTVISKTRHNQTARQGISLDIGFGIVGGLVMDSAAHKHSAVHQVSDGEQIGAVFLSVVKNRHGDNLREKILPFLNAAITECFEPIVNGYTGRISRITNHSEDAAAIGDNFATGMLMAYGVYGGQPRQS